MLGDRSVRGMWGGVERGKKNWIETGTKEGLKGYKRGYKRRDGGLKGGEGYREMG